MKNGYVRQAMVTFVSVVSLFFCSAGYAENIDPGNNASQYTYGENVGWFNAEPIGDGGPGVEVDDLQLTGYIWGENIGWINLNPTSYGGVSNDGNGNLSGYALGENVGWINFSPANGGVTIDSNGNFDGWAWGENIGWVHFQNPSIPYKVKTAWVPSASITTTTLPVTTTITPPVTTTIPETTTTVTDDPSTTTTVKSSTTTTFQKTTTSSVRPGPDTTTTTITAVKKCMCKKIYGEGSEEVVLLRYIRDNVLSQTPEGQEIIGLYYQWNPVMVELMEKDEEFKEEVKEMIDGMLLLITEEAEQILLILSAELNKPPLFIKCQLLKSKILLF